MDLFTLIRYKAEIEDAFKENLEAVAFSFKSRRGRDELFAELGNWLEHHDFGVHLHTEMDGNLEAHMLIVTNDEAMQWD